MEEVRRWLKKIGSYVAIRDCLALSFALDYDREGGDPKRSQTKIGALRTRAKPYNNSATKDTFVAANELVKVCIKFLEEINCYDSTDIVVAMPPSEPGKPFNLPMYLAEQIALISGKNNLSEGIFTISSRPSIKNITLENKLEILKDTIAVDEDIFSGENVLLIDDLYQSGISMNYAAMLLLEKGAKRVFGLTCEKTCSNDDNISRRPR